MWKEEEHGAEGVNRNRMHEAIAIGASSGAKTLAVGCPFCMIMLTDAAKATGDRMQVLDIADLVSARLIRNL